MWEWKQSFRVRGFTCTWEVLHVVQNERVRFHFLPQKLISYPLSKPMKSESCVNSLVMHLLSSQVLLSTTSGLDSVSWHFTRNKDYQCLSPALLMLDELECNPRWGGCLMSWWSIFLRSRRGKREIIFAPSPFVWDDPWQLSGLALEVVEHEIYFSRTWSVSTVMKLYVDVTCKASRRS